MKTERERERETFFKITPLGILKDDNRKMLIAIRALKRYCFPPHPPIFDKNETIIYFLL